MKTFKILFAFFLLTTGIANAQFTRAELQISGLSCALCARATENTLKNLPFISEVKPDFMRNLFVITFKNNTTVNFDQVSKAVHDAGFFISFLKANLNFDKIKIDGSRFNYGPDTFQVMNAADKPLAGEVVLTIVDKGFAPRSVTKKYLAQSVDAAPVKQGRLYHVAI